MKGIWIGRWRGMCLFLLLVGTAFTGHSSWAAQGEMQVVTEEMPPYNYLNDKGVASGFSVELLQALLVRSGLAIDSKGVQLLPWARAYQIALYEPDTLLFTAAKTDERRDLFQWVGPIGARSIWFWALKSRQDIQAGQLSEAIKYRVAAVRNSASAQQLSLEGFTPLNVNSESDKFRMLLRGRVDLVTALELGAAFQLKELGHSMAELKPLFVYDDKYQYYFAVSKQTDAAKVAAMQQALEQMRADGSLEALRQKWLH